MKRSLDEFIRFCSQSKYRMGNEWVDEPGFSGLYVRYGRRYVLLENGPAFFDPVLDIADVEVEEGKRGKGIFTNRIAKLQKDYPGLHIYVENASLDFQRLLIRLGFKPHLPVQESFFLESPTTQPEEGTGQCENSPT